MKSIPSLRFAIWLATCACGSARGIPGQITADSPEPPGARHLTTRACSGDGCAPSPPTPRPAPGASCGTGFALPTSGTVDVTLAASSADHPPALQGCTDAAAGSSVHFSLDLRQARDDVPIALAVDADYPFAAALARGPCDDAALAQCAVPADANSPTAMLLGRLAPDRYDLVVSALDPVGGGTAHVSGILGTPSWPPQPPNDACSAPLPIDISIPAQSLIGSFQGATASITIRCADASAPDVFYSLDLSAEAADVLVDVEAARLGEGYDAAALFAATSSGCGELLSCGQRFSSRLAPGLYRIAVLQNVHDYILDGVAALSRNDLLPAAAPEVPYALFVATRAADAACAATTNVTWQTALDIDPTPVRQHFRGNTACGSSNLTVCADDRGAPELFYRLDLRGVGHPIEIALDPYDSPLERYLLAPDGQGGVTPIESCGPGGQSQGNFFTLAPRLYYLVIDGRVRGASPFDFELSRHDPYPVPAPCVTSELERCMRDSEPACTKSLGDPRCLESALDCGLAPAAFDAFCAAAPGCCEGSTDAAACLASWKSSSYCP
jgi:hypothetical protein